MKSYTTWHIVSPRKTKRVGPQSLDLLNPAVPSLKYLPKENKVMDAMSTAGLIVSVIGGVLGGSSIVVTWKLYQASMKVNLQTVTLLAEIKTSSHTTEVTSTRFTERLVGALVELLGRDVKSSLVVGHATLQERIDFVLRQALSNPARR